MHGVYQPNISDNGKRFIRSSFFERFRSSRHAPAASSSRLRIPRSNSIRCSPHACPCYPILPLYYRGTIIRGGQIGPGHSRRECSFSSHILSLSVQLSLAFHSVFSPPVLLTSFFPLVLVWKYDHERTMISTRTEFFCFNFRRLD